MTSDPSFHTCTWGILRVFMSWIFWELNELIYKDLVPCAAHSKCLMVVATKNKKGREQNKKEKKSEVNYCCLGIRSHLEIWTDILNPEPLSDFECLIGSRIWISFQENSLLNLLELLDLLSRSHPCEMMSLSDSHVQILEGDYIIMTWLTFPQIIFFQVSFQSQLQCHLIQELFPDQHLKVAPLPHPFRKSQYHYFIFRRRYY